MSSSLHLSEKDRGHDVLSHHCISQLRPPEQSATARGFHHRALCPHSLEARSPRSDCHHGRRLGRALFPGCRWPPSCCESARQRERSSWVSSSSYKGANPLLNPAASGPHLKLSSSPGPRPKYCTIALLPGTSASGFLHSSKPY